MSDPAIFEALNEIGIINQLATAKFKSVLPDGMEVAHFSVLNHLVRLGDDRTLSSIARAFQVTKPSMTNTIQRLEARGLVTVVPDPVDGRAKRVLLTPEGRTMRDRAIGGLGPAIEAMAAQIDPPDFRAALPFLKRLRAYLDAERDVTTNR
jgi:DNA-binding MarR family transcriptional regulator